MVIKAEEKRVLDVEKIVRDTKKALKELAELKSYDEVEKVRLLLMQVVKRVEVDDNGEITIQTYI